DLGRGMVMGLEDSEVVLGIIDHAYLIVVEGDGVHPLLVRDEMGQVMVFPGPGPQFGDSPVRGDQPKLELCYQGKILPFDLLYHSVGVFPIMDAYFMFLSQPSLPWGLDPQIMGRGREQRQYQE